MAEFRRSIALVIGINDYRNGIPPLRTAVNDAVRLARILEEEHSYQVHPLVEEVTRAQLEAFFAESLKGQVSEEDRLLVYFAGHGIALDGDDGPAGFLIPQDARPEDRNTFLPMTEFHDWLDALPCRHLLAILDCCFAGAFRWASTRDLLPIPPLIHQERYDRFIRDPAWQVISSAAYDQKALDVLADVRSGALFGERGEGQAHSPFALALFEALAGAGDVVPAGEGDGVITATELYLYLRDSVEVKAEEQARHRQTPGLWPLSKHNKGEYILLVPGHELNLPPAPELTTENNPYRGLQSFDEEHAELFFGRTALVEDLAQNVSEQPLTVVLGASGTGKSSLVKAGLLPHLRGTGEADLGVHGEQAKDPWYILPPMRPTESPLRELGHLLQNNLPLSDQTASVGEPPATLATMTNLFANWGQIHPHQKLLLILDQFEELVTLCQDDHEREQFLNLLNSALVAMPDHVRIVLTLRSDFEPQLSNTALQAHWQDARFVVPPMSQAELREAIEGPASVRVLYFEPPGLIDRLIDEVIQTPGALPLLSFTLSELYIKYIERRSENRALTEEDYKALGGVAGSLRNRATEEYEKLDPTHQATMKRIMLRMVTSEGGELSRRRVPRSELIYPDEVENQQVETIITRLTQARLIVGGETKDGEPYIEPAHDALVRAWDMLLIWSREAEEYLPVQRRLTQAANDWANADDEGSQKDLLWNNDPRLPQVEQALAGDLALVKRNWLARQLVRFKDVWGTRIIEPVQGHWLNRLELDFVQQSVEQRRKETRRLVGTVTGVIVVLMALTIFAFYQVNQTSIASNERATAIAVQNTVIVQRTTAEANAVNAAATAVAERNIALSRQLAANSAALVSAQPDLALLIGLEAMRVAPGLEASSSLLTAFAENPYPLSYWRHHNSAINSLAFSPDSKMLISAEHNKRIILWDVASARPMGEFLTEGQVTGEPLSGHWVPLQATGFSPDSTIAVTSDGRSAIYWDVESGTDKVEVSSGLMGAHKMVFSQDLLFAALGTEVTETEVGIWNVLSGQPVELMQPVQEGILGGIAFSPDGSLVATSSQVDVEGRIAIWDVASRRPLYPALTSAEIPYALAFHPKQRSLFVGYQSGQVGIIDVDTGTISDTLTMGELGSAVALAVSPDGKRLAAADTQGNVSLLFLPEGRSDPRHLGGSVATIACLDFSPDNRWLAAGADDGTILVWDLAAPPFPGSPYLSGLETSPTAVVYSPDGETIAAGYVDGEIIMWSATSNEPLGPPWKGHEDRIESLSFDASGRYLASGSWDGDVLVWDVLDGAVIREFRRSHNGVVQSVSISDGPPRLIAAGDYNDPRVIEWDWASGERIAEMAGEEVIVTADGSHMALQTDHSNVMLWNRQKGERVGQVINLRSGVGSMAYSPDGKLLAIGDYLGNVAFWDAASGAMVSELLHEHSGLVDKVAFSPDGALLASNGFDAQVALWDVEKRQRLAVPFDVSSYGTFLAFSPDGNYLISDGRGDSVVLWDLDVESWRQMGCEMVNRNLTQSEWDNFIGVDVPYQRTCPEVKFTEGDLERVLQAPLGAAGIVEEFELDNLDSGLVTNERVIEEDVDPELTIDDLEEWGRILSYRRVYQVPEFATSGLDQVNALIRVGLEAELYTDDEGPATAMNALYQRLPRLEGQEFDGARMLGWESFPVEGLGDEAWGVRWTWGFSGSEVSATHTGVAFRWGELLASVSLLRTDDQDVSETAKRLAAEMEARMQEVFQGERSPDFDVVRPMSSVRQDS